MKPTLEFDVTDISALQAYEDGRFVHLVPKPDRPLIRKALEAGFKLPGVTVKTSEPQATQQPETVAAEPETREESEIDVPHFQRRA